VNLPVTRLFVEEIILECRKVVFHDASSIEVKPHISPPDKAGLYTHLTPSGDHGPWGGG